jgi:hypothetical protein
VASPAQRLAANVAGDFFVDSTCMKHKMCIAWMKKR